MHRPGIRTPTPSRDALTAVGCDQIFVNSADRPTTGNTGTGQYSCDPLERQTTLPAADAPNPAAGDLTLAYYDSDLPQAVTQAGITTGNSLNVNGHRQTAATASTGPGRGWWSCDAPLSSSTQPVHKKTVDATYSLLPSTTLLAQYQRFTRLQRPPATQTMTS